MILNKKDQNQCINKLLKDYMPKISLSFLNKTKYQNLETDMEQLKNENLPKQVQKLQNQLNKKKDNLSNEMKKFRREFDDKLALSKLDYSKFRDQISEIQEKTVHEAEKVLGEFSKKKLSSKNKKKMCREELERHLEEMLKDRKQIQSNDDQMDKLKKQIRKCEEMIKNGRVVGLEDVKDFKGEINAEVNGLKKGEFIKEMVENEVKRLFKIKQSNGWESASSPNTLLK